MILQPHCPNSFRYDSYFVSSLLVVTPFGIRSMHIDFHDQSERYNLLVEDFASQHSQNI